MIAPASSPAAPSARNPWAWIPTLYFAQGIPYVAVMTLSVVMYKSLGISNTDIALYTSWLYLPWVIKPLWSPVVDLLRTRRWWIWVTQVLVGAGFAGIALTIPAPDFFKYSLAFFWLLAFSSATHDIAADGFYLLATTEKEQAFFVGIRSTFYRIASIFGQGLLVILAGLIQANTGLPSQLVSVKINPEASLVNQVSFDSEISGAGDGKSVELLVGSNSISIAPVPRPAAEVSGIITAVRNSNLSAHFYRERTSGATPQENALTAWWRSHVANPLGEWLRSKFGRGDVARSDRVGNVGLITITLSKPPEGEVVVTPAFKRGDKSISLVEGSRLVFDQSNWNRPALVVIQVDPKLAVSGGATFEIRAGNIPLSWVVVFFTLMAAFLAFAAWHKYVLPSPISDRAGARASIIQFWREFFRTFGTFFAKEQIGRAVLFLLVYRLGESQLVKMVVPFLLDGRELGGLGLTTAQVGIVYGTIGIISLTFGGLLGGVVVSRHGLKAWLWPMVFIIHVPDAIFVYLAAYQPDNIAVISACVALEQFGYGFGFTAFMLFMVYLARGANQTAHYAICTGFMALGMMLPGMPAGWLQEHVGYTNFFVWVCLATIPSFVATALLQIDPTFGKKS